MVLVQLLKIFSLKIDHTFLLSLKTVCSKIIFFSQFSNLTIFLSLCRPPRPVRWGLTYCFTDVHARVRICVSVTPMAKGTPAQIFREACCLFPRALAFDYCYDLDLCSQGLAVRVFFV